MQTEVRLVTRGLPGAGALGDRVSDGLIQINGVVHAAGVSPSQASPATIRRVGFGVAWPAAPYLAICRIALDRVARLATEQAGPADADLHPG